MEARSNVSIALVFALMPSLLVQTGASASPQVPVFAPGPAKFDVVSVKPNKGGRMGTSARFLPDGTALMTGIDMSSVLRLAVPSDYREVVGLPDWATRDRYDINAKPPIGSTDGQRKEMIWNMFVDRMKISAHGEQRERNGYALVVARSDGRLGRALKLSDCPPSPSDTPSVPVSRSESGCGSYKSVGNTLSSVGAPMDLLARLLGGFANVRAAAGSNYVTNRTGLAGLYVFTLTYSPASVLQTSPTANPDAPPDIFTALPEQLGLRLQAEKVMVPVLVIERLERPTQD